MFCSGLDSSNSYSAQRYSYSNALSSTEPIIDHEKLDAPRLPIEHEHEYELDCEPGPNDAVNRCGELYESTMDNRSSRPGYGQHSEARFDDRAG